MTKKVHGQFTFVDRIGSSRRRLPRDRRPPAPRRRRRLGLDALPGPRRHDRRAGRPRRRERALDRLGPAVGGERETGPSASAASRARAPSRARSTACSGPMCQSGHARWYCPISIIVTSNGPRRAPMSRIAGKQAGVARVVHAVRACRRARSRPTASRPCRTAALRPDAWRAGVQTISRSPTRVRSHQSSSTMRDSGTPQYARCAPTPSGTTKIVLPILHRDDGRGGRGDRSDRAR